MHLPKLLTQNLHVLEHSWQRSRSSSELQHFVTELHERRNLAHVELDVAL